MTTQMFQDKLKAMARLPDPLREYAETVGAKLDDGGRSSLMAKLEVEYAGFSQAIDTRDKRQAEMAAELDAFQKTEVRSLQDAAEQDEHDAADQILA